MNTVDAGRLDGQVAATDSTLEPRDSGSAREDGRGPAGAALPGWLRVATASPRVWAALVTGLFMMWNLVNLHEYGLSYDEPAGMGRGEETARLFRVLATGGEVPVKLTSAAHEYHPGFYAFGNYQVARFLTRQGLDPIAAGHVLNVLVAALGLGIVYLLAGRLYGGWVGLWAVLFLALYPRFVAHAHYNGKDVPVMVFTLLTIYLLCLAHERRRAWLWGAAGVALGVAINAKLEALLVLPMLLGAWLTHGVRNRDCAWRRDGWMLGVFLYCAAATVFLLWPRLWVDPWLLFRAVGHFSGEFNRFEVSYLGQLYSIDAMPWHFLGMHLLAVSPVVMLVCLAIGVWQLARQVGARDKTFGNALLMLLLLVPLMARLYPGALQYDGMRHVFVVVPVLAVLAGLGIAWVLDLARGLRHGVWWRGVLITGVPLWLLWQNVKAHPYQGSYLNEVVRAVLPARELADHFDFHSWGTPLHHGVRWLNAHAPAGATVYVPHHRHLLEHYRLRPDLFVADAPPADLVMYPSWRRDLSAVLGGEPRYAVQCYGADLLLIHVWRDEDERR